MDQEIIRPTYAVAKSNKSDFRWMVIAHIGEGKSNKIICYIPTYFEDDEALAKTIAISLNTGKYIPNLEIA